MPIQVELSVFCHLVHPRHRTTEITVYDTNDIAESLDSTWIVSGQSPVQKDMIRFLPKTKALYVEGAFRVWLREAQERLTPHVTPANFQIC